MPPELNPRGAGTSFVYGESYLDFLDDNRDGDHHESLNSFGCRFSQWYPSSELEVKRPNRVQVRDGHRLQQGQVTRTQGQAVDTSKLKSVRYTDVSVIEIYKAATRRN